MYTAAGDSSEDVTGSPGDGSESGTNSEELVEGSDSLGDDSPGANSPSGGEITLDDGDEQRE
jgi:hypothetical protein